MPNISLHGEDIQLQSGKPYFIVDALYLDQIKNELSDNVNLSNLEDEIREKIFPYTETPFAVFTLEALGGTDISKIEVSNIKRTEDVDSLSFSTDTGLIVILQKSILLEFLKSFNYNELVEGLNDPVNISYWLELEKKFGEHSCGLILSPGIKSGFDFDGSGQYKIEV